ncbi:MAG: hypothetical protein N4A72_13690 [Bacteroidales bacterium]|jgi:hypothetical protein|nr:hypothetical protein [Bacteroidales bacterium]
MIRFLSGLCIVLLIACSNSKTDISFYNWKNSAEISTDKAALLQKLNVEDLYVRFFDIDIKNKRYAFRPKSVVNIDSTVLNRDIIPCVFITNRSLYNIPGNKVATLAKDVVTLINKIADKYSIQDINQIQIDCDWTKKSRPIYFELLKRIRDELDDNIQLSVTIRLHQIKYPEITGVPPVDRGALMVYNMGDIYKPSTNNSIFDIRILESYIGNISKYKLPLDVALPLFSWGVVYRFGKPVKIIHPMNFSDTTGTGMFIAEHGKLKVKTNGYFNGQYLYIDDVIRVEEVSFDDIIEGATLINSKMNKAPEKVILYNLNSKLVNLNNYEKFENLRNSFN